MTLDHCCFQDVNVQDFLVEFPIKLPEYENIRAIADTEPIKARQNMFLSLSKILVSGELNPGDISKVMEALKASSTQEVAECFQKGKWQKASLSCNFDTILNARAHKVTKQI